MDWIDGGNTLGAPAPSVLVTGGGGLIGSALSRRLAQHGCRVHVVDHQPMPATFAGESWRVQDIRSADWSAILDACRPLAVVHLAACSAVTDAERDPRLAVQTNVNATIDLLEAVARSDATKRFVFASSSTVYGHFHEEPAGEDHRLDPVENYGRTKMIGEQLVQAYCQSFGKEFVIIRPTAVYGPEQAPRRVVSILIDQAKRGAPMTIDNDGTERLDFTYVEDVAEGFARAALVAAARNVILNLSYGQARSINELARLIAARIPGSVIAHRDIAQARPRRGALDSAKAWALLQLRPRYSLEEGLSDLLTRSETVAA